MAVCLVWLPRTQEGLNTGLTAAILGAESFEAPNEVKAIFYAVAEFSVRYFH